MTRDPGGRRRRAWTGTIGACNGRRAALAPLAQSHGMTPVKPVSNKRSDDKHGNSQQPYIPTRPKRGVVHDDPPICVLHEESKHHTVVGFAEGSS